MSVLQPIAVGTADVESLSGYVQRLAEWHAGAPGQLLHRYLAHIAAGEREYIGRWRRNPTPIEFGAGMNGFGQARAWVAAVEECAGVDGLIRLTTSSWDQLFTGRGLRARHLRWCAPCLQTGRPYHRLSWTIEPCRHCSTHGALSQYCPGCGETLSVIQSASSLTTCPECGSSICGADRPQPSRCSDDSFGSWASEQIRCLIAADEAAIVAMRPLNGSQLRRMAKSAGVENLTTLARLTGTTKAGAWNWWHGRNRPTLENALRVCYTAGTPLVDALLGRRLPSRSATAAQLPLRLSTRRLSRQHDWATIKQRLNVELVSDRGAALASIARKLDVPVRLLRQHEPELCHGLAERHRARRRAAANAKAEQIVLVVGRAYKAARDGGTPVSQRELAHLAGHVGLFCRSDARQALQRALTGHVEWSPAVTFPAAPMLRRAGHIK